MDWLAPEHPAQSFLLASLNAIIFQVAPLPTVGKSEANKRCSVPSIPLTEKNKKINLSGVLFFLVSAMNVYVLILISLLEQFMQFTQKEGECLLWNNDSEANITQKGIYVHCSNHGRLKAISHSEEEEEKIERLVNLIRLQFNLACASYRRDGNNYHV